MFFHELMQFTNGVENITVFCKFNKWTKGNVQQVPACMSRVSVLQDPVARRRVGGKGKQGPFVFDGGVLLYQPIESDHCAYCQFTTLILWYIAVFWVLTCTVFPWRSDLTLPMCCGQVAQNLWISLMNNYEIYCGYFEVISNPNL